MNKKSSWVCVAPCLKGIYLTLRQAKNAMCRAYIAIDVDARRKMFHDAEIMHIVNDEIVKRIPW